jgi:predicted nucleic acid-binding protein
MILLDTNIVSETWRVRPDKAVVAWLEAQPVRSLYLCTPVLAELRFGAELLDAGIRRERLRASIDRLEHEGYRGRVLVLDGNAAAAYGRIAALRQRAGTRMELMDAMIAAIALTNNAKLATRDVGGFVNAGIEIVNPFDSNLASD